MGRRPSGAVLPFSWLRRAGYFPAVADLSVETPSDHAIARAKLIVVSTPMHTALRLGSSFSERVRRINPDIKVVFHGLYAWLNRAHLFSRDARRADFVVGGEAEDAIVKIADAMRAGEDPALLPGVSTQTRREAPVLARLPHPLLDTRPFPAMESYARLKRDGREIFAGVVESTRGCKHVCRHCPLTPVYGGRFFGVDDSIVFESVKQQVEEGAGHITFADPDFLNGPTRALKLLKHLHREYPMLSFDFTAKVEHLIRYREMLPDFGRAGTLFVVSAAESLNDRVLTLLDKGHTADQIREAVRICRRSGIVLRPTWVTFTPWTDLNDFQDILSFVEKEQLVYSIEPVQLAIRLLVPPGSTLVNLPQMRTHLKGITPDGLSHIWEHSDPAVDALQKRVTAIVSEAAASGEDEALTFARIKAAARNALDGTPEASIVPLEKPGLRAPGMSESWFCCAEPTESQLAGV